MDSRHESIDQENINKLINMLNLFLAENKGIISKDNTLRHYLENLINYIYHPTKQHIQAREFLNNENLFSEDMVLLPVVSDSVIYDNEREKIAYLKNMMAISENFLKLKNDAKNLTVFLREYFPEKKSDIQFFSHEAIEDVFILLHERKSKSGIFDFFTYKEKQSEEASPFPRPPGSKNR